MTILMRNTDEYPAHGSLVLGRKTEEGPHKDTSLAEALPSYQMTSGVISFLGLKQKVEK